MRKILVLLLCFCIFAEPVYADALPCSELCSTTGVSGFVFTTESQTVLPNTLSAPITIQSQNESGVQESTAETTDLTFTSTSGSGQFLSSTGKVVSKTMSKGTSNRTFYYSDTRLGTYTLTVTATGRTSKKSFSTTQHITIASVLPAKPVPVIKTPVKSTPSTSLKTKVSKASSPATSLNSPTKKENVPSQPGEASSTNVATVYEGVREVSAFDSLFDLPGRLWYWLKNLF